MSGFPDTNAGSSVSSVSSDDDPAIAAVKTVIAQERTQFNWMPVPSGSTDSDSPGLEYLSVLDTIIIDQQIDLSELKTHQEKQNRYRIKNKDGQDVYFAAEKSSELNRQYSGSGRQFSLSILDSNQREVIRLERPGTSCSCYCCGSCCTDEIEVQAPAGRLVGHVRQDPSGILRPWFSLVDSEEQVVLRVRGPLLGCLGLETEFEVLSGEDGDEVVGRIRKVWGGEAKERYTDAERFEVHFPKDLSEKNKAVLIGATFLIDFMFFERSARANAQQEEQEQQEPDTNDS